MRILGLALSLLAVSYKTCAQQPRPGGGGGGGGGMTPISTPGESTSTACPATSGNCAYDGSSAYADFSALAYTSGTGKFSGSVITNQCSNHVYGVFDGVKIQKMQHSISCIKQTIPPTDYATTPVAAPVRGRVALSLGGSNIYTAFEAGFTSGQICTGGSCDAGLDLEVCHAKLEYECSNGVLTNADMLLDDCGGHAMPYHHHQDLVCDYNVSSNVGHAPLIAVALDGRGIYGKYEKDGALPSNLDACNGHFGDVPGFTLPKGASYSASTNVYHYHTSDTPPYTIGCFGSVQSLSDCKNLYSTCGTGYSTFCSSKGKITFDTDCPCFSQGNETYNQNYGPKTDCPNSSSSSILQHSGLFVCMALVFLMWPL